jgi:hypothetical protein
MEEYAYNPLRLLVFSISLFVLPPVLKIFPKLVAYKYFLFVQMIAEIKNSQIQ